jgi:hypothetical protein
LEPCPAWRAGDRVILVPGTSVEIETVRWMYKAFVEGGIQQISEIGGKVVQTEATQLLTVNGEFTVSVLTFESDALYQLSAGC